MSDVIWSLAHAGRSPAEVAFAVLSSLETVTHTDHPNKHLDRLGNFLLRTYG